MATRQILDAQGNVIGNLTLPDDTSEAVWQDKLNSYKSHIVLSDVTPRQIRQALILSGVSMDMINEKIELFPEPKRSLVKVEWDYSIAVKRSNPLINEMAASFGWTGQQVDALWLMAQRL